MCQPACVDVHATCPACAADMMRRAQANSVKEHARCHQKSIPDRPTWCFVILFLIARVFFGRRSRGTYFCTHKRKMRHDHQTRHKTLQAQCKEYVTNLLGSCPTSRVFSQPTDTLMRKLQQLHLTYKAMIHDNHVQALSPCSCIHHAEPSSAPVR